jgi:hypothetical protein
MEGSKNAVTTTDALYGTHQFLISDALEHVTHRSSLDGGKNNSSSAYEVKMITFVLGASVLICRHASMPEIPGIRTFKTATSG